MSSPCHCWGGLETHEGQSPALEQPLIKHPLPGARSWAQQEPQRLAPRGCPGGAGSWQGTQPELLSRLLAAAVAEPRQGSFTRSQRQVRNQPLNSKQMEDVEQQEIARGAVPWNRSPGTCARVLCWTGPCQRTASHLRNCCSKTTLHFLQSDFVCIHGT